MEEKMERDTRGKENTGRRTMGGLRGIVAVGIASLISLLPGCSNIGPRYPGEMKPVAETETEAGSKLNIYKLDTQNGKRFVESFPSMRLLDYNEKTKTFKIYETPENRIREIPANRLKFYNSIEELEKDVKKKKGRGAGWFLGSAPGQR